MLPESLPHNKSVLRLSLDNGVIISMVTEGASLYERFPNVVFEDIFHAACN